MPPPTRVLADGTAGAAGSGAASATGAGSVSVAGGAGTGSAAVTSVASVPDCSAATNCRATSANLIWLGVSHRPPSWLVGWTGWGDAQAVGAE